MVPVLSIIFMLVSAAVCFAAPFIAASVIKKQDASTWAVFFVGMLGFFLTQILIRIPLLSLISAQSWYVNLSGHMIWFALFLAVTAALFETFGRFVVFKWLLKKHRSYHDGIMAGLGHGAIEAILLAGFTLVSYIVISLLINMDLPDALIGSSDTPEAALASLSQTTELLSKTPSAQFLLSGWERLMTLVIHIALSLLVLEGIRRAQVWNYLAAAAVFHTLVDFTAAFLSGLSVNIYLIECILLIFTAAALFYIIAAKKRYHGFSEATESK